MSMSTEQAKNPNPPPPHTPPGKSRPLLILLCIAGLVTALAASSLLWTLHAKKSNPASSPRETPLATPTEIPTWTPTPIIPPADSLFYDTFASNSHGWSVSGEAGYYRILADNMLVLANAHPDTFLVETVPTASSDLRDYLVTVDFTIDLGDSDDSTGLYLRGDSVLDHDYRVDINGNGTFDIAKEWLDAQHTPQTTMLVPPQPGTFLHPPGKMNRLSVIMLGPMITVSINNVVVAMVNDPSYASGQIALFAHDGNPSSEGLVVSFYQVEIDQLTSPLLTPTPPETPPNQ